MNLSLVSPFIIFDTVVFDLHSHEVKKARGERKKRKSCLSKASLFSFSDNRSFCSWECRLDFFGSFLYQDKNEHNYSYTGNRLTGISEAGSSQKGFTSKTTKATQYDYDVNGNMVQDLNKGISSINYNHLNLPESITIDGSNINYQYDATGVKLKKEVKGQTTEYSGVTVYKDDKLEFIHMPEGYIEPHNNGYRYVYRLTDHLGNTRVSFTKNTVTDQAKVLATNDYYPFGLEHQKAENTASSSNIGQQYKFNGKELQTELDLDWYDLGARMYSPTIGRFMTIDPLADFMKSESTYGYAFNNPIYYTDPDGRMPDPADIFEEKDKQFSFNLNISQNNNCPDCAEQIDLDEVVVTPSQQTDSNTGSSWWNLLTNFRGVQVWGPSGSSSDLSIHDNGYDLRGTSTGSFDITGSEAFRALNTWIDQLVAYINSRNVVEPNQSTMETKPDPNEPVAPVPEVEKYDYYTEGVNKAFFTGGTKSNETPFRSGPFDTRKKAEKDSADKSVDNWTKASSIGIIKEKKN